MICYKLHNFIAQEEVVDLSPHNEDNEVHGEQIIPFQNLLHTKKKILHYCRGNKQK